MDNKQKAAIFTLGLVAGFSLPKICTHLFYWAVIAAIIVWHYRNPIAEALTSCNVC